MQGPELGVHADDIETPEIEQEPKQEVLENKDVSCSMLRLFLHSRLLVDYSVSKVFIDQDI